MDKACIDDFVIDHDVIFDDYDYRHIIRDSKKWEAWMVKDRSGNKWSCIELKKSYILDKARKRAIERGMSIDEAEADAVRDFNEYREGLKEIAERVKGRFHTYVAKGMGFMYNKAEDRMVFVSEHIPGIDLLAAAGKVKPDKAIFMYSHVLEGLNYIHQNGFLHLNFKYSRAYVDLEADEAIARLTDFGSAVPLKGYTGEYSYTSAFAAPEVILGQRDKIDERADLYSVGATWYFCSTKGQQPFNDRAVAGEDRDRLKSIVEREKNISIPPSHYNKDIPPELDEFVMGLLQKDVEKRQFVDSTAALRAIYRQWPETGRRLVHEKTSTLESHCV